MEIKLTEYDKGVRDGILMLLLIEIIIAFLIIFFVVSSATIMRN